MNTEIESLICVSIKDRDTARQVASLPDDCFTDKTHRIIRDALAFQVEQAPDPFELSKDALKAFIETRRAVSTPIELASVMNVYNRCFIRVPEIGKRVGSDGRVRLSRSDVPVYVEKVKKQAEHRRATEALRGGDFARGIEGLRRAGGDEAKVARIEAAVQKKTGTVPPKGSCKSVSLVSFDQIEAKRIEWLWEGRIPVGKVCMFVGDGGVNKSTVAYDLAARVSVGANAPLSDRPMPRGGVLIVCGDDDPATDIRPRLDVMGADLKNVFMMDIRVREGEKVVPKAFELSDLDSLRKALEQARGVKLIVIDPVSAFVGKADANKHADVYSLVAPLNKLAEEFGVAVAMVSHTNKGGGKANNEFRGRINGSGAWSDASRSAFLFTKDKSDPDLRYMTHGKCNAARQAKGLAFRVVQVEHPVAGPVIKIEWEAEVDLTADQALSDVKDGEAEKLTEAVEFLRGYSGAVASDQLVKDAGEVGITERTLWRAKEKLGIKAAKRGFGAAGGWYWNLPNPEPPPAERSSSVGDLESPF